MPGAIEIAADTYAPKYWKPELVHFINSWGRDKVLFGTDFPVIDFRRATSEIEALNLKKESEQSFIWKNAARVYGLEPTDGFDWRTVS